MEPLTSVCYPSFKCNKNSHYRSISCFLLPVTSIFHSARYICCNEQTITPLSYHTHYTRFYIVWQFICIHRKEEYISFIVPFSSSMEGWTKKRIFKFLKKKSFKFLRFHKYFLYPPPKFLNISFRDCITCIIHAYLIPRKP